MPVWWNWKYTIDLKSIAFEDCKFESCYRYIKNNNGNKNFI